MSTPDESDALVVNAADKAQVAAADAKVKRRERAAAALMRQQLSTYQGREFLWATLGACQIFRYIGGGVEDTYRGLGRRDVGMELWGEANKHPQLFLQMQNEAIARARTDREENRAARVKRSTQRK